MDKVFLNFSENTKGSLVGIYVLFSENNNTFNLILHYLSLENKKENSHRWDLVFESPMNNRQN